MADKSPKINHAKWGRIEVEGAPRTYKDAKLFPGGSREWDWNETGTHHNPGIQPADIEELLENDAEVVVLSKGYHERLQVKNETLKMLKSKGIDVHVKETGKAINLYNELRDEHAVGGLFHSTC